MAKDPRADKVTFLDPGTFVAIIDRNHAVFQDIFPNRREVQSLLVQVSEARNRWAHSLASSDLADDDLVRALMSMEKLLSDAGLPRSVGSGKASEARDGDAATHAPAASQQFY